LERLQREKDEAEAEARRLKEQQMTLDELIEDAKDPEPSVL